jgi:phage baseplate assembly protein W
MAVINYAGVVWVDVNSNLGEDTDPELVVDIAAINNSLLNLLSCPIGSRPFEREYGSELYSALFEPADSQAAAFLDMGIFQAIRRWEPRIQMDLTRSSVKPTSKVTASMCLSPIRLSVPISRPITNSRFGDSDATQPCSS